jgi:SAM-dependent methyltransferase
VLPSPLPAELDAFGHALADHFAGRFAFEVVERDDGLVFGGGVDWYFAPFRDWWVQERRAMRLVRGRVLDVGSGPGRFATYLQEKGHPVVAMDVSPLAVDLARRRGVHDARAGSLNQVLEPEERFDTVLLLGNNIGLLQDRQHGARFLRRLARLSTPRGRILAGSFDPYDGADEVDLRYHEQNRRCGRMAGQLRIRIRYRHFATPWFDFLFASREEVAAIAAATGWTARRFIDDGPGYVAVLEREP